MKDTTNGVQCYDSTSGRDMCETVPLTPGDGKGREKEVEDNYLN